MTKKRDPTERYERRKTNARLIYDYILNFETEWGFPPTIKELAEACFMARSTVVRHLDWLEAWGYISREPGLSRAITIIDPKRRL